MANLIYPKAGERLLSGGINLLTNTVKVVLVDTSIYNFNTLDEYYSSVFAGVVSTPQTLINKTVSNGVFDAANTVFPGVNGPSVEALVFYIDTGDASTSPLLAYMDSLAGLPATPNTGDINITYPDDVNKILAVA